MARVILHIDLNAFFASCEEIKNPDLKEFPVAVGSTSKRGVISTANYEARKYGVHSAMPVYEALRLCPDLVLIQGDYGYYRSMSAAITSSFFPVCMERYFILSFFRRPISFA